MTLIRYVSRRVGEGVVSIVIIAVLIFFLSNVLGDPVRLLLPSTHTHAEYLALREAMGYNEPVFARLGKFLVALATGDFGTSTTYQQPVTEVIIQRLPVTVTLMVLALFIGGTVAILLGSYSGFSEARGITVFVSLSSALGLAIPIFAMGMILIIVFAIVLGALPVGGWGSWLQVVLPATTLSIWVYASIARLARSSAADIRTSLFVTLAETKGLSRWRVFAAHVLRPSLSPVISYIAWLAGVLLSGAVLVETLFGIPGLGSLAVQAVKARDQQLVVGIVIFSGAAFVLLNILGDFLIALLDPRVRFGRR